MTTDIALVKTNVMKVKTSIISKVVIQLQLQNTAASIEPTTPATRLEIRL